MDDVTPENSKDETPRKPGRPVGHPKSGGRKKGTPNKNSWNLRNALDEAKFNVVEELLETLDGTSDNDKRWQRLQWLCDHLFPRLKEIEAPAEPAKTPQGSPSNVPTESLISLVSTPK